jgi:hypothetical protein
MTAEEVSAARSLWKFVYAQECFRRVASTCAFILQNGLDENHPAYYPMIVAIYALYGKPFKQTDVVGALPRNIVPAEFRPLHDVMIEHRDEVYMHTQPGRKSEVRVRVSYIGKSKKRKGLLISTEFYARPLKLLKVIELCQAMHTIMEQRRVELQNRHFTKHLPKEEGEYPLNVSDPAGPFFLPKQPPLTNT